MSTQCRSSRSTARGWMAAASASAEAASTATLAIDPTAGDDSSGATRAATAPWSGPAPVARRISTHGHSAGANPRLGAATPSDPPPAGGVGGERVEQRRLPIPASPSMRSNPGRPAGGDVERGGPHPPLRRPPTSGDSAGWWTSTAAPQRRRGVGRHQRRILGEDVRLQLAELRAGVEAELLDECLRAFVSARNASACRRDRYSASGELCPQSLSERVLVRPRRGARRHTRRGGRAPATRRNGPRPRSTVPRRDERRSAPPRRAQTRQRRAAPQESARSKRSSACSWWSSAAASRAAAARAWNRPTSMSGRGAGHNPALPTPAQRPAAPATRPGSSTRRRRET